MTTATSTIRLQVPYKAPLKAPIPNIPDHLLQTASTAKTTWEYAKETIGREVGRRIRDAFFMPMPAVLSPAKQAFFEREEAFFANFLDPDKPLDKHFPSQERIRNTFTVSDQQIFVQGKEGQKIVQTCRVFESKITNPDSIYTHVFVAGNLVTIHNNIVALYPYLEAFLNQTDETTRGRFIIITQNDMIEDDGMGQGSSSGIHRKPDTIDEAGYILTQTLLALSKECGKIDQVTAHSLGCLVLAGALDYLSENKEAVPRHVLFDRGPSSVEKTSKLHWGGSILSPIADRTGWGIDVGQKVSDFCLKMKEDESTPEIVISSVVQDHHFSGEANLYSSPQIEALQKAGKVFVAVFDPAFQIIHENAHHSFRTDSLIGLYLVPPSSPDYLRSNESLAENVIHKSLQTRAMSITEMVA